MKSNRDLAVLEAIFFLESDAVDTGTLAKISGFPKDTVLHLLSELQEEYQKDYHGIELVENSSGFVFLPKRFLWNLLKDRYGKKNSPKLSRAGMETLSIVAYTQPITKSEIDGIRGVQSDGMLKMLQEKELVRIVGKKDAAGLPLLYGTTKQFLKAFRLKSLKELPRHTEKDEERFR
jgi:segregation and condensation protein B